MKALVYTAPDEVTYRDEPEPVAAPGEAIVRIEAAGICGSDMHAYHGHDPRRVPPLILGHEASGLVIEGAAKGRRAAINPMIFCGACADCLSGRPNLCANRRFIGMNRAGTFAELVAVPEHCLIEVPETMDPVHAALTEPAATALHAVTLAGHALHRPIAEARALVLGGGSIGLLSALLLRHHGCRNITLGDTNPLRRATAERTDICSVYDPLADAAPEADSFELVIDAVGAPATREAAVAAARPGGVIMHIGLQASGGELDVRKLTLSEITFIGAYTYTPVDLTAAVAALASGALGPLDWVEERGLEQGSQAFDDLHKGRTAAAKVVLLPR
jgi:alcohol dehydrogenase